jgi:hypothetical protein
MIKLELALDPDQADLIVLPETVPGRRAPSVSPNRRRRFRGSAVADAGMGP